MQYAVQYDLLLESYRRCLSLWLPLAQQPQAMRVLISEHPNCEGEAEMNALQFLDTMKARATMYRKDAQASLARNAHMNSLAGEVLITQDDIDAVLVDFINFNGMQMGVDYALYVQDLSENEQGRDQ